MSKVAIQGNASGTGTFTIQSPATNTDRALTLPDEAGTVLTSASDIESQVKTATNASGSAPIYACRAWVLFNGTGTVAINGSGNVASITDVNVGRYIVNFSTAMPDASFSHVMTTSSQTDAGPNLTPTTTSCAVRVRTGASSTDIDVDVISVAVFR